LCVPRIQKSPPAFARDVAHIGHWGIGDVELRISNPSELEQAAAVIRQSFAASKRWASVSTTG
jgi:predicted transport protein